jgi:hypothetical protein
MAQVYYDIDPQFHKDWWMHSKAVKGDIQTHIHIQIHTHRMEIAKTYFNISSK